MCVASTATPATKPASAASQKARNFVLGNMSEDFDHGETHSGPRDHRMNVPPTIPLGPRYGKLSM